MTEPASPGDAAAEAMQVDARGLLCPLPVLRLRKRLQTLPLGARVALIATDEMAAIDVPHFCGQSGHELIESRTMEDGATLYLVQRGPEPPIG